MIRNDQGRILLERRTNKGIWGGLWCFPEYTGDLEFLVSWCETEYGIRIQTTSKWSEFPHDFTHFRLMITPLSANVVSMNYEFKANANIRFISLPEIADFGIPSPVKKLVNQLQCLHEPRNGE